MWKRLAALLVLVPSLGLAQPVSLPYVQTVNPTDAFPIIPHGVPSATSLFATILQLQNFIGGNATGYALASAYGASCTGTTPDDAAFQSLLAAVGSTKTAVVDCPLFLASPQSISTSAPLQFMGAGKLIWNFGTVTQIQIPDPGRDYAAVPSVSITGNATLGPVVMQLYNPQAGAISGGIGCQVGDVLTLPGGTGTSPTVTVTAQTSGNPTAVSLTSVGALTALPSNPITATGGHCSVEPTFNPTWNVQSVAITSGGTYASGTIPTITFSGGSPTIAAEALAIGQQPTFSGTIFAPPMQIFGGYAVLGGLPNQGRMNAAWFGANSAASDNTAALQAGIYSALYLDVPQGQFNVNGCLIVPSQHGLRGVYSTQDATPTAHTTLQGTATSPSCGKNNAFIRGYYGPAGNTDISLADIGIGTSTSAGYTWAIDLPNLNHAYWYNVRINNNSASCSGGGGAYAENETQVLNGSGFPGLFASAWVNDFEQMIAGAACGGYPWDNETTDGRVANSYLSGGSGSIEAGGNMSYANNMFDNSATCFTIQSKFTNNTAGPFGSIVGGNFQNCTAAAIEIAPGPGAYTTMYTKLAGVNFNHNTSSLGDIYLHGVDHVSIDAIFSGTSSANIYCDNTVDYVEVTGILPQGVSGSCGHHTTLINGGFVGNLGSALTYGVDTGSSSTLLGAYSEVQGFIGTTTGGVVLGAGNTGNTPFVGSSFSSSGGAENFQIKTNNTAQLQVGATSGDFSILTGHIISSGTTPSLGATCGTSPSISGSDIKGKITTGTGAPTSCTVTFAETWASTPTCVVVDAGSAASVPTWSESTTALSITLSAGLSSGSLRYQCWQ